MKESRFRLVASGVLGPGLPGPLRTELARLRSCSDAYLSCGLTGVQPNMASPRAGYDNVVGLSLYGRKRYKAFQLLVRSTPASDIFIVNVGCEK